MSRSKTVPLDSPTPVRSAVPGRARTCAPRRAARPADIQSRRGGGGTDLLRDLRRQLAHPRNRVDGAPTAVPYFIRSTPGLRPVASENVWSLILNSGASSGYLSRPTTRCAT